MRLDWKGSVTLRKILFLLLAGGAASVAWYQAGPAARPLAQLFPSGALVYLEAKDFSRLLADWNSSTAKQDWLNSANYTVFQQSNLFLKLAGFYKSYGAAAGFAPDLTTLRSLAGDQSALALYDLQHVQFAYVTRLSEAKVAQTRLWTSRRSFETRQASGFAFYINHAEGSTVAFASANGYLLVATDEERMAGMLGLLAGKDTPNIAKDAWYKQSTDAAGAPSDLRLAMNLENLVESSYFRSYWVQRNTSYVRNFLAGVADIHRSPSEIREERIFLKRPGVPEELPTPEALAAAGSLAQLAPDDAGLSRVWARPAAADVSDLLETHIFNPRPHPEVEPRYAPPEENTNAAGSEADLETRIDQPPLLSANDEGGGVAARLMAQEDVIALLQVQRSQARPASTFISLPCAVALQARTPWNADQIKAAISGTWTTLTRGAYNIYRLDGLGGIAFTVNANLLILATDADLLEAMIDRPRSAASASIAYGASFRHQRERANYGRLMTALDFHQGQPGQQPAFFSANIASLSASLQRVTRVELTEQTTADRVTQRVIYTLR